jgi:cobalt-zinc-cadmium efflux system protein
LPGSPSEAVSTLNLTNSATHDHDHDFDHAGHAPVDANQRRQRRLTIALGLNALIVVAQVLFGLFARSLGLIADAGHNLTDVAAVLASLVAIRWARRRPTGQRSFGYHRATILAALGNAVSILVITVWIVYEGIQRLIHPEPVRGSIVLIVAAIAAVANILAVFAVREDHSGHAHGPDLNMRSAMLHLIGDAAASVGVAIAGTIILLVDGAYWLDPAVSLALALLIAVQAWRLMRATSDVLLESTPAGIDIDEVGAAIEAAPGVESVHDLHMWSLSSDVRALSAHVVLRGHPTLEEAQVVGTGVKSSIGPRFSIAHITLELECETCSPDGPWCAMDADDLAAPAAHGHHH